MAIRDLFGGFINRAVDTAEALQRAQQRATEAARDKKSRELRSEIAKAKNEGSLSEATFLDIFQNLDTASTPQLLQFEKEFKAEIEGTSAKGRSRLGTEKLFETLVDQPGRRQTLLTPRSNSSRGILGV
jgi:hypothetical protein